MSCDGKPPEKYGKVSKAVAYHIPPNTFKATKADRHQENPTMPALRHAASRCEENPS